MSNKKEKKSLKYEYRNDFCFESNKIEYKGLSKISKGELAIIPVSIS